MAEQEDNGDLQDQTRVALLTAIKASAEEIGGSTHTGRLLDLARAYATVIRPGSQS